MNNRNSGSKRTGGLVLPKYTNAQLSELRRREVITQPLVVETSRIENRKKVGGWKRAGLLIGAAGVLYALSGTPAYSKDIESQIKSSQSKAASSIGDFWDRIKTYVENGYLSSRQEVVKKVEAATPVVSEIKEQVVSAADDARNYAKVIAELLPAVEPEYNPLTGLSAKAVYPEKEAVTTTPLREVAITPAVTRKLSQVTVQEADTVLVEKIKNTPKEETDTPRPASTLTPLAQVDLSPDFEGTLESAITDKSPFMFSEANEAFNNRNLVLADLFYPAEEKIMDFDALYTEKDILPMFPDSINQWSGLTVELCNKHNEKYKDQPSKQINPNFILAIMSIESQGIDGAQSSMFAKGLMQITTPVAERYGFNSRNIFEPENNLSVSISYFADLKATAISLGLKGGEVYEFAAMAYNGGWNADKYFMTSRVEKILQSKSAAQKVFNAKDMIGVKEALMAVKGNINSEGDEYFTFGTNLTKVETLKYREKLVRFVVVAQLTDDIIEGLVRKGLSKDKAYKLARKFMKTSDFIKAVNSKIREESNPRNYFEEKEAYIRYLTERFNLSDISFDKSSPEAGDENNPAWYLMYR